MESIVWRPAWLSPFAALAYTIGLGNVWRFPHYSHTHGGFVFLVPYCCILLLVVYPLLLLQMTVGQYCSRGSVVIYGNVAPIVAGLGWSLVLVESILTVYYNVQVSWILYYVLGSVFGQPWTHCENQFNTEGCVSIEMLDNVTNSLANNETHSYATEEYFYYDLLGGKPDNWDGLGPIQMKVMACLVFCWMVVFLILSNDVYAAKMVIGFTVGLPWILLLLLLIHVLLFRCGNGIRHITDLDWSHAFDPQSYLTATAHAFKSFGLTLSGVTSIASHNTVLRNIARDAALIVAMDTLTAILSYVVVSYTVECLDPNNVFSTDHKLLAFVAYPMAVARIKANVMWAPVFFITFFTIGISSQAMMVLSIVINLKDRWPSLWLRQYEVLGMTCSLLLLLGLPLCTRGGADLIKILATATGGPATFLLCLLAACSLAFGCGFSVLRSILTDTFQLCVPRVFSHYLKLTWLFVTPMLLGVLCLYSAGVSLCNYWQHPFTHPTVWGDVILNATLVTPVVVCALHTLWNHQGAWRDLFRPTADFLTNGSRICRYPAPPPLPIGANQTDRHGNGVANGDCRQCCSIVYSNSASGVSNRSREASNSSCQFVTTTQNQNLQRRSEEHLELGAQCQGRREGPLELGAQCRGRREGPLEFGAQCQGRREGPLELGAQWQGRREGPLELGAQCRGRVMSSSSATECGSVSVLEEETSF